METELAAPLAEIASESIESAGGGARSRCHTVNVQVLLSPFFTMTHRPNRGSRHRALTAWQCPGAPGGDNKPQPQFNFTCFTAFTAKPASTVASAPHLAAGGRASMFTFGGLPPAGAVPGEKPAPKFTFAKCMLAPAADPGGIFKEQTRKTEAAAAELKARVEEPRPETNAAAHGIGAVRSDDVLTLVCLADGADVRVPFSAAARESELIRIQMDDVEEAGPRLDVHVLEEVTAVAFSAFLQGQPADRAVSAADFFHPGAEKNAEEKRADPSGYGSFTLAGFKRFHGAEAGRQLWVKAGETVQEACRRIRLCGARGPVADFLGDAPQGFAALYAAADYLIAPRWRSLLVDAWATALLAGLSPPALATAAEAAAAALDPAVSPLLQQELPEAVLFQFLDLPETEVAAHARRELVRRVPMLPDLALAKLRGFRRDLARQELLRRHPQLTPFDNGA